jgi:hypothetical protein
MDKRMIINNQTLVYRSSTWQFYWLCSLILSFAYERPLAYLTPFDRTNPRLFDLLVIIGILTVLPRLRNRLKLPRQFKIWGLLVSWFCFCAVIWAIIFDWQYGKFSLFAATKYIEGLLAIYMAISIPLDSRRKRILHGMLVLGGIFVAIYCLPEFFFRSSEVVVREGLVVNYGEGVLVGPYGASYFQLAQSSSLFFAFALTFFLSTYNKILRYSGPLIVTFVAWPLVFSGARTGLALMLISTAILICFEKRLRKITIFLVIVLSLVFLAFDTSSISKGIEAGNTIQRLQNNEGGKDSIETRMSQIFSFPWSSYQEGNLLPLIGGGFYVVPASFLGSSYYYRIDYGIHSIYLFPLEQAGILGLVLFLWFLFTSAKGLFAKIKERHSTDLNFANSFFAYFIASLVVGIGGHNFWQGFASGNFNTCFMICLLIALIPSVDSTSI